MKKLFKLASLSFFLGCLGLLNSQAQTVENGAKKIRVGLAAVKTASVGEGLDAQQFSVGIQSLISEYLKSPKIEIVALEARLPTAIETEIKEKSLDYVVFVTASHKKGGGGFGKMFSAVAPALGQIAPMAGMGGSVAGAVAGQVASTAIMTAATMSQNVKAKDAVELNVTMQKPLDKSNVLTKQFKAKAKANGEDIITPLIEQTAQAIMDAATGKAATAPTEKN
jgi:hypothetical protein